MNVVAYPCSIENLPDFPFKDKSENTFIKYVCLDAKNAIILAKAKVTKNIQNCIKGNSILKSLYSNQQMQ